MNIVTQITHLKKIEEVGDYIFILVTDKAQSEEMFVCIEKYKTIQYVLLHQPCSRAWNLIFLQQVEKLIEQHQGFQTVKTEEIKELKRKYQWWISGDTTKSIAKLISVLKQCEQKALKTQLFDKLFQFDKELDGILNKKE